MPAFSVVTNNEPMFRALYERVFERTKFKMKGYVAVQRKLLIMIYTLWKNETKYESNYLNKLPVMLSKSSSFRLVAKQP